MSNEFILLEGKSELLADIDELWQKLNNHHIESTEYFKEKFREFTFAHRTKSLLDKAETGDIQVLIAKDKITDRKIGYCVSTVNSELSGEIDSLFVEKEFRKFGIGDMLISKALDWLESKGPKEIVLTVAGGNERVLDFYKKYGFYTTSVKMSRIDAVSNDKLSYFKDIVISSDKALLKLDDILALLGSSYWASERSKEKIVKSIENSLCFGVYHQDKQIGFARMITDYATHAYLCDVIINKEYRGQGIGQALMTYIMEYPALQDIKTMCLLTNDAHKLYEKYGFANMEDPGKFMMKRKKVITN
jgi:ribosomal protein S18 acetylase RimI-like enzyme